MDLKLQQRSSIRFCVLLKKSGTETLQMIQEAYGDQALSKTRVFEWHKKFKDGQESLEDAPRAGRPSTSKTDVNRNTIDAMLQEDRRLSIAKIADMMHISYGSVEDIIHNDLGYRKVAAKWIPRVLHEEQMSHRVVMCQQWITRLRREPNFLDKVVTCDESWFHHYDPETKQQSAHPTSPRPKKQRCNQVQGKSCILCFSTKLV